VAEIHPRRVRRHEFFPYLEHAATLDLRVFLGMLAHAARHSALDVLARVEVPTLVVAGGNDGFTPPELSVAMAEAIPGAELLLLADGTHVAPLEYPDEINAAVGRFLSELGEESGGGSE
jgi:pimeloyl-ACP methyl ester carboxylesterase